MIQPNEDDIPELGDPEKEIPQFEFPLPEDQSEPGYPIEKSRAERKDDTE